MRASIQQKILVLLLSLALPPLVLVGGEVRAMGAYPTRDKLLHWVGLVAITPTRSDSDDSGKAGGKGSCGCGPKGCA